MERLDFNTMPTNAGGIPEGLPGHLRHTLSANSRS